MSDDAKFRQKARGVIAGLLASASAVMAHGSPSPATIDRQPDRVHIDGTGEARILGYVYDPAKPAPDIAPRMRAVWTPDGADGTLIPESQWSDISDPYYPGMPVYDQDGKGACNGFACIEALEDARAMAGLPYVPLSAWYLYGNLCKGFDVGSNPAAGLQWLSENGTCRDSLVPYGTINPWRFSAAAKADAANFKAEVGYTIDSRAALMTALMLRMPCVITMCVGAAYGNLDENGCVRIGWGYDNHALSTTGRVKRSRDGKRWCVGFRNHWTKGWGDNGFADVYLDDLFRNNSAQAFAVRMPKPAPDEGPPAPVLGLFSGFRTRRRAA